jgi:murein DD-endopeptidase MepM/ murein hydrolase activator NlpD
VGPLRRGGTLLAGLLAAALLLPLASPASAEDPRARRRRIEAELARSHDDLDESSAAVRQAAAALAAVAAGLPAARQRLAEAEGMLSAARAGAAASAASLTRAQADLAAASRDHAAASARLAVARRRAGQLARSLYMTGPGGFAGTLLSAGSVADLAARATYVHALLSDGTGRVRAANDARVDLANRASVRTARQAAVAARDRDTRAALARVESLAAQARDAAAAVAAQVATRRSALGVAARERAADLARYQALAAESKRLAELIRRASRGTGRIGRGGLLWPTPGPVTSGFGYRIHPIYGYRRFHPGIDIGAPTGQGIVAVLPGVVVSAGPMGTYGNIVVIDHGNGFATAYAHQSRILVRAGQRVVAGQRIGLVGSTGAATGPHLHFETRVNGEAVDPLQYY